MRRRLLFLVLLVLLLALGGDAGIGLQRPRLGGDTRIAVIPVPLDPAHPARTRLGALRYLGGWVLESPDPAFGSFSAMAIDRGILVLLSDAGGVMRLSVDGAGMVRGAAFGDLPGGPRSGRWKRDRDSESMASDPGTGQIWVGFENANAIARYAPGLARMDAIAFPPAMALWPTSGGPEAMLRLRSGRFLVFSEKRKGSAEGTMEALAFAGDPVNPATPVFRFSYRPPEGYRLTEAAELPDGRLILLNRRLSLSDYVSARVVIADPAAIRPGAILVGREIAALARPLTVDNMEAMAVTQQGSRTILWIGSDDNFKGPFQRNLLMKFALDRGI